MRRFPLLNILLLIPIGLLVGCQFGAGSDESNNQTETGSGRYLYVASGGISAATGCYGGGVATSGASAANTVVRYDVLTGAFDRVVADYSLAGDIPVSIVNYDSKNILVMVENTGGRRVDLVNKSTGARSGFLQNGTALNGVLRSMVALSDNSLLISKSTAIEKLATPSFRFTVSGNPYVNAPGGSCATSTTLISSVAELPNGKILFAHAAASPNNRIGIISQLGYATTADCLASVAAPATTALPTSLLVHTSGKLLVTFGSTTATSNFIYAYDVDATANTITGATAAYPTNTVVNGPTAMTEDRTTAAVFVANGTSTFNTIEKFTFNASTKLLTRQGSVPFIPGGVFTRCVTGMLVAE